VSGGSSSSDGLSKGAIAGIVIGVVFGVLILICLGCNLFVMTAGRNKKQEKSVDDHHGNGPTFDTLHNEPSMNTTHNSNEVELADTHPAGEGV